MLPQLNAALSAYSMAQVESLCLQAQVPFGPVRTPLDLLDDVHLKANGSLLDVCVEGQHATVPSMPFRIDEQRPEVRLQPQGIGAQTAKYLDAWGLSSADSRMLFETGAVAGPH